MDKGMAVAAIGAMAVAAIALGASQAHAAPGGGGGGGGGGTPSPCGTLDAGIDTTTAAAVCQAIGSATTTAGCATLLAFATSIATKWPIAAALCVAKATALGCPPSGGGGGSGVCVPGASILSAIPAAAESDLAYALGAFLNGSDVLTNNQITSDLSWWVNPSGQTQGGGSAGGGGPVEAAAPFPLESNVHYVTSAQVGTTGMGGWQTPTTWPPYMTTQAVDINNSDAPDGTYYVCDGTPGGELYAMTKGGGNTTLQVAYGVTDWSQVPGGNAASGGGGTGGGATPSTLQTLLGDMGKFGIAVDALQQAARLEGFAQPAGLPGSVAGVLDVQTLLTLAAWLLGIGDTAILAGTDSGILGAMQGALPGVISWAKAGCTGTA